MTTIKSKNGGYAITVMPNGDRFMAFAEFCDGETYGGNSYWFTIGSYKTEAAALRWGRKKMAAHGIEF